MTTSAPTPEPSAAAPAGPAVGRRRRPRRRGRRAHDGPVPRRPNQAPLDRTTPAATAPAPSPRSRQQGVRVDVVRDQAGLESAGVDGDTTVLVANTDDLAEATIDTLVRSSGSAQRLVVVGARPGSVGHLAPDVQSQALRVSAGDLGTVRRAARATSATARSSPTARSATASSPGPGSPGRGMLDGDAGYSTYLASPPPTDAPPSSCSARAPRRPTARSPTRTTPPWSCARWGTPRAWSGTSLRHGHPVTDTSRRDEVVPGWVGPTLALLTVVLLGVMLWRGRRLGRLVSEPLPAVVRAAETTESRGRLYRKGRDTGRAGAILQRRPAAPRRLPRLPPGARSTSSSAPPPKPPGTPSPRSATCSRPRRPPTTSSSASPPARHLEREVRRS